MFLFDVEPANVWNHNWLCFTVFIFKKELKYRIRKKVSQLRQSRSIIFVANAKTLVRVSLKHSRVEVVKRTYENNEVTLNFSRRMKIDRGAKNDWIRAWVQRQTLASVSDAESLGGLESCLTELLHPFGSIDTAARGWGMFFYIELSATCVLTLWWHLPVCLLVRVSLCTLLNCPESKSWERDTQFVLSSNERKLR